GIPLSSTRGDDIAVNHVDKQSVFSTSRLEAEARASTDEGPQLSRRKLSFSSEVLPGVVAGLDSLAILSTAAISFVMFVGSQVDDVEYYAAAICFVWVVVCLLMSFGDLYRLEPIMSPVVYADKIIIVFMKTF